MPTAEDGIPEWDRARLTQGLRGCDSHAIIAFYSHFRPILTERAQLFGIPPDDCADAVETFLGDILLKLCSGSELPKSLHVYLFVSFKRYASRIGIAKAVERNAMEEFKTTAVRESRAAEYASPLESENYSLARFASALLAGLSSQERLILGAKAEEMPLREIAVLLGVNYNAANTRFFRLRTRLRADAARVVLRMDVRDRMVVERFLRRARATTQPDAVSRLAALSAPDNSGG